MTKKQFWQAASNWGFLVGAGLFAMNIIGWALKLEAANSWVYELLLFLVICPMILYTGKRNADHSGPEGYSYGRAVGFVFAMMMFAGIVYGVGRFLMYNFIAAVYYDPLIEESVDLSIKILSDNNAMFEWAIENREILIGRMKSPFWLIIGYVVELTAKGGFLGLILCAALYKKPDIFAVDAPEQKEDNESGAAEE